MPVCYDYRMEKGPISISITPGTIFAVVGVALTLWLLLFLKDLVLIVLASIVIASAVEPGVQWFIGKGLSRGISVAALYGAIIAAFLAVAYFFFPPLVGEMRAFIVNLPQFLSSFDLDALLPLQEFGLQNVFSQTSVAQLLLEAQALLIPTGAGAFQALSGLVGGIFSFLLILVLSIYFTVQETGVDDFLRLVVPLKHQKYALDLWKRSHHKIGLWMQGQLILSLIMGVLGYLLLAIFQVPYAFLIAIFAAFIEIVPVFGSIVSGTIATLIAGVSGGLPLALIVAGGFVIINLLQSNLIYPLVVKQIVGVPPLMVILFMIAGGSLAGFFGVLLSVPLAATLQEFITDFQKNRKAEA